MSDFKSNRITLFREQYDAISKLPASIQGKVYKALMDYNFMGIVPKLDATSQLAFDLIKAGLDVSLTKQRAGQAGGYQRASNSQAGSKQELSRTPAEAKQTDSKDVAEAKQEASKSLAEVKQEPSRTLAGNSPSPIPPTPKEKYREERETRTRPIIKDVVAIGKEIGLSEESCRQFHRYYDAQHWQYNSGLPIDDVKAALERWQMREEMFKRENGTDIAQSARKYSKEELDAYLGDTEDFEGIEL